MQAFHTVWGLAKGGGGVLGGGGENAAEKKGRKWGGGAGGGGRAGGDESKRQSRMVHWQPVYYKSLSLLLVMVLFDADFGSICYV